MLVLCVDCVQHLRRLNNFNSYLAILSAVDSAPIRRLEWPKPNVEVCTMYTYLDSFVTLTIIGPSLGIISRVTALLTAVIYQSGDGVVNGSDLSVN